MPVFKFKLEKLLEIRKQKLEEAQSILAKLKRDYQAEVKLEAKLRSQIFETKRNIFSKKTILPSVLFIHQNYLKGLERKLRVCLERQQILSQELTLWRQEVLKRNKEKKILEKLKQKQWELFWYEQRRKEQKELDDLATLHYQHKMEGSF
ncbi:flagellar FliJ protein [Desulfonauticus submarinus]|uniref:Flagellar FliJ protein n=1 Tax=Desulfonauticus submarinus TaxID=206665 RepID=A0A1H0EV09_9BACT|nr:hypothetical protein [Desulfonauticus submarinus]SDN86210.1 flagellar FliJ protein [Desulfonauticus submarinus]